jgi:hypothetical protein
MKKITELVLFWLLPIVGLLIIINNWQNTAHFSLNYLVFKLTFPMILMYLVVGTGAGYFQMWSFHTPYTIKKVIPQIGIIYSVVLNLSNILILPSIHNPLLFLILTSLTCGLLGTLYDIPIIHYALLKVGSSYKPKFKNALTKVLTYGPVFFSMAGFANGIGLLLGYSWVEKQGFNPLFTALVLAILIYLPFFFI